MVGEIPEASPRNDSNADPFLENVACCSKEVDVKLWLQFEQERFSGISAHELHPVSGMPSPKDPLYMTGLQVAVSKSHHWRRVALEFQIFFLDLSCRQTVSFSSGRVPAPSTALVARRVCPAQAVSLSTSGKRAREIIKIRNLIRWLW